MTGREPTYFGALENMQRQDVAVMIYRLAGSPSIVYRNIYPDVAATDYFANAAVWAYDNNIITGQSGYLGVGNNITRQDFITILYRYAAYKGYDISASASLTGYTDYAQVSPWALTPMKWAVANGIIGQNTTILDPTSYAPRAQIAAMVSRFDQLFN